jgi:small subunit ribosomal protein S17
MTSTASDTPPGERAVNRKARTGVVVSDKNEQTVVVAVMRAQRHRLYHKVIRRTKRYQVHDPENRATIGDLVRIEECRPISKQKRWQLVDVMTERDVAEVAATEIDRSLVQEVQRSAARAAAEEAGEAQPEATLEAAPEAQAAVEEPAVAEPGAEASTAGTADEPAAAEATEAEAEAEDDTKEGEQAER